ncbi:ATP-binding cassette domain-containing protein [Niallia circulans]|uniref:ATP-binding cassette domain-containing protein n=1 Tax=Niallia circulans TaxID=1397 RepID=A0A941GGH1_NIACI|nr:ATP-binding cassette domain-containing protein [Niallia circulans]MCB5239843.1 ATP-binding cassette domain-containing protein [Niallia circulans]
MSGTAILMHNVKKAFGDHPVLNDLNLEVTTGSIFALLGENGAGKTTTVRILSTLLQADEGTVEIAGMNASENPVSIREVISLTGQSTAVDELLTGKENLELMGRLNHLQRKEAKKRASELLEQFDLVDAANKMVKQYSGGMRRRLDIAISLIKTPKIIFLDEPTTGLDPRSRKDMWNAIKKLAENGVTIFLTTQYLEEADQLASRIAVINQGRIVEEGTANELKQLVGEEKIILQFFNGKDCQDALRIVDGQVDWQNISIEIATDGNPEKLRQILNRLHEAEIKVASVHSRKPTLDDVFMKITEKEVQHI